MCTVDLIGKRQAYTTYFIIMPNGNSFKALYKVKRSCALELGNSLGIVCQVSRGPYIRETILLFTSVHF